MVNHKGAPLVLASESKAHAQVKAPRKGSKAPSKHIKPSRHVSELSSDHLSSGSASPAGHSPPNRPSKRLRTEEPRNTAHDHRPIRKLPQQLPIQHADLGLKRKVPGGPPQPKVLGQMGAAGPSNFPESGAPILHKPHGVNPPTMPIYPEMRGSSMPQPAFPPRFPPPSFPPPMPHMPPSMYQQPAHGQLGYWGHQQPQTQWQQPAFPFNMTPEQYQEWYATQQ